MEKVIVTAADAVGDIPNGAAIACGGLGMCGVPVVLIDALVERGINELEVFSNNCSIDLEAIHLAGVYIDRVVPLTPDQVADEGIEWLSILPSQIQSAG
jgi:acyl CoA:acetate/3-ketoacid CoA transferase alpha subunit